MLKCDPFTGEILQEFKWRLLLSVSLSFSASRSLTSVCLTDCILYVLCVCSFYADFGPLNLAMLYRYCCKLNKKLKVSFYCCLTLCRNAQNAKGQMLHDKISQQVHSVAVNLLWDCVILCPLLPLTSNLCFLFARCHSDYILLVICHDVQLTGRSGSTAHVHSQNAHINTDLCYVFIPHQAARLLLTVVTQDLIWSDTKGAGLVVLSLPPFRLRENMLSLVHCSLKLFQDLPDRRASKNQTVLIFKVLYKTKHYG